MKKTLASLIAILTLIAACAPGPQPSPFTSRRAAAQRTAPNSSLNQPPTRAQLVAANHGRAPTRDHQAQVEMGQFLNCLTRLAIF